MKLGYELKIEQKQQLSMTPELIQAIKILQLNSLDLFDYVQNELLDNPILEESLGDKDKPTEEVELIDRVAEDYYDDRRDSRWENDPDREDFSLEKFTTETKTLEDFLIEQLNITDLKGNEKNLARFIIEALDDNGYITISKEEIMLLTNSSEELIDNVLKYIHSMEPIGVGTFHLAECLELQLKSQGRLTDQLSFLINNMLDDVANNRISKISKTLSVKPEEVQNMVDIIKSLEPKPGRQFAGSEITKYVIPDVIVEKINGEYVVSGNESNIPKLKVSSYYNKLVEPAKKDPELNEYITDKFNSAMWLIKSIEQRKQTILNVAAAIVNEQNIFFEKGEKYIKQLTLKDIAQLLNIHESTVSRAINGKYMQTPMGVYELKYFFNSGVPVEGEKEGVSSVSVKSFIKEFIAHENPKKPYSDQALVEKLKEEGIEISRRTVAKYRESLGILSSSKRRRF